VPAIAVELPVTEQTPHKMSAFLNKALAENIMSGSGVAVGWVTAPPTIIGRF